MLIGIFSLSLSLCEGNGPETIETCLQSEGIRHIVYVHTVFNNVCSKRYEILFSLCVGCKQNNAIFDVWLTVHRNSVWIRKTN